VERWINEYQRATAPVKMTPGATPPPGQQPQQQAPLANPPADAPQPEDEAELQEAAA
jgi:hypothetical protein